MTGTKVEAVHHHGVDALERFVVGTRARAPSSTPTPTACSVCRVDVGDGEPAADRLRRAQRRGRPDRRRRAARAR